mgnify:CR=1 FL=1
MKTPYPHILSCIAVSILTACGGGGGGGTPSVAPTPTYPIVQPGNIPNPSGQTERTATPPAGNQADANNALEASEENIHKEVEDSVNSTQTSSENQNQDVKADSNDKAEVERKAAEEAAKAKAEAERKAAEEARPLKRLPKLKQKPSAKLRKKLPKLKPRLKRNVKRQKRQKRLKKLQKPKLKLNAKRLRKLQKPKLKERKAAEEAAKAKAEAERKAAEEAAKAKAEAERKAAEEAAKAEAERKAAEEAAKAKVEAERKAAEEAAKAKVEAERKAAEEATKAKAEAERKAAEEAAKVKAEEERKAAEEAAKAKAEAERKAAEEAAKVKAEEERKAAEEAAKAKAEEERKAAEEVTPKAEVAPAMQSIGGFYTMLSVDGADNKVINRVGNPDVLEVNGQKINLLPQTFDAANGMLSLSDNKIIRAIGTHLQYGHYGFYGSKKDNGELNSSLVFYQGLMTPVEAMPQTGSAIYQGNAFYNDVSNINTVGSSLFNVDFGEKSLTGGVYSAEGRFNPVMLQANIAGNRFVYVDGTTKNSMSGIFLGPQAEEMAGRFDHPSEGKSGTFGASMLKD